MKSKAKTKRAEFPRFSKKILEIRKRWAAIKGPLKTVEQLAKEQGVKPIKKLEDILGKGAHLFKDDRDFEEFLAGTEGRDLPPLKKTAKRPS